MSDTLNQIREDFLGYYRSFEITYRTHYDEEDEYEAVKKRRMVNRDSDADI